MFSTKRQMIRAVSNPLDKCTVFSIFPKEIRETKPTISPGAFVIPAGSYENPSSLVVGPSSWFKTEAEEGMPVLEVVHSSLQVADSVVNDYCQGLLACDMGGLRPGIFFLLGEVILDGLEGEKLDEFNAQRDLAKEKQINWFKALVKLADVSWARTGGNPLGVDDTMRLAATELGHTDKAWLQDFQPQDLQKCPVCGTLRDATFPMCQHCRTVIDQSAYDVIMAKTTGSQEDLADLVNG